jgi:hypothetical protein
LEAARHAALDLRRRNGSGMRISSSNRPNMNISKISIYANLCKTFRQGRRI